MLNRFLTKKDLHTILVAIQDEAANCIAYYDPSFVAYFEHIIKYVEQRADSVLEKLNNENP